MVGACTRTESQGRSDACRSLHRRATDGGTDGRPLRLGRLPQGQILKGPWHGGWQIGVGRQAGHRRDGTGRKGQGGAGRGCKRQDGTAATARSTPPRQATGGQAELSRTAKDENVGEKRPNWSKKATDLDNATEPVKATKQVKATGLVKETKLVKVNELVKATAWPKQMTWSKRMDWSK